jgi:hypothetical protein
MFLAYMNYFYASNTHISLHFYFIFLLIDTESRMEVHIRTIDTHFRVEVKYI